MNINASVNVTTEAGSYSWLVAHATVQRQTGRHAGVAPSMPSQIKCADGRYVNTGIPPRRPAEFGLVYQWLEEEGLLDELPEAALLQVGGSWKASRGRRFRRQTKIAGDFGRDVRHSTCWQPRQPRFFTKAQNWAPGGVIHSPEEALEDPPSVDRECKSRLKHPGAGSEWFIRGPLSVDEGNWDHPSPPLLGEPPRTIAGGVVVSFGFNFRRFEPIPSDTSS